MILALCSNEHETPLEVEVIVVLSNYYIPSCFGRWGMLLLLLSSCFLDVDLRVWYFLAVHCS